MAADQPVVVAPQFMRAVTTFHVHYDGRDETIVRGENLPVGHPLIAQNPQMFRAVESVSRWSTVEQATAGPGEKRSVGRRLDPSVPKEAAK